MTVIDLEYRKLLADELPRAIHSEEEYRSSVARAEKLIDKKRRTTAENRYLELLTLLIECYEEEHDPILPPDPLDALKELMAATGMSQVELSRLLGSSGIASEVLSGKRSLSKAHIKALSETFSVSTDIFI